MKYIRETFHRDGVKAEIIDDRTVRVTDSLGGSMDLKCRDCIAYPYRVSTVSQFKVLQYLYKNMPMDSYIKYLTILSPDTIRTTDRVGDHIDFTYEDGEIKTFSHCRLG